MKKKQESIDNAVVTSKIAGVVKSINQSSGGGDYASEEDSAYMTILAVGDFRVKGTVSESNVQMLSEQQQVILRSRVDEDQTWTGTISKIDTQNEASDGNSDMMMYDSGNGAEKATKYPFYITMDSTDGLMMGQHLFIELDEGQTEKKEGIWLFEGYIVRGNVQEEMAMGSASGDAQEFDVEESLDDDASAEDLQSSETSSEDLSSGDEGGEDLQSSETSSEDLGSGDESGEDSLAEEKSDTDNTEENAGAGTEEESPYVWAVNDRNRLEKRQVELGEYDEAMGAYEILSGLTEDDYIAFPMEGLYEGVTAVTSVEEVDYESPLYNQGEEGENPEEGEPSDDGQLMKDGGFESGGEMMEEGMSDGEGTDESLSDMESISDEDMSLEDESEDGSTEDETEDETADGDASGDGTAEDDQLSDITDTLGGGRNDTDLGQFERLQ